MYESTTHTQKLILGVDTGSGTIGTVVSKDNGDIIYITKANRIHAGSDTEHYYDACTIAAQGKTFAVKTYLYKKKCISEGDFQKTKGIRSELLIVTEKICGFRKFDIYHYSDGTGKDHVHILLEYSPKVSVSYIIKQLKQYSTYQMWKFHEDYLSRQCNLLTSKPSLKEIALLL